jgi:hypothetical protein
MSLASIASMTDTRLRDAYLRAHAMPRQSNPLTCVGPKDRRGLRRVARSTLEVSDYLALQLHSQFSR